MNASAIELPVVKSLIGGTWQAHGGASHEFVYNPSTGEAIATVYMADASSVDNVVQTAANSLPKWAATPVVERARVMFRFRELMEKHFEELAALITREHGKTLSESRAELNRGIEMVEFSCGIPSLLMGMYCRI